MCTSALTHPLFFELLYICIPCILHSFLYTEGLAILDVRHLHVQGDEEHKRCKSTIVVVYDTELEAAERTLYDIRSDVMYRIIGF